MRTIFTHLLVLLTSILVSAQSFEQDRIVDVSEKKQDGSLVMVQGSVDKILPGGEFILKDTSGSITVQLEKESSLEVNGSDEMSVFGKVFTDEKIGRYILASQARRIKYVKDPAHCCQTE